MTIEATTATLGEEVSDQPHVTRASPTLLVTYVSSITPNEAYVRAILTSSFGMFTNMTHI